MLKRIAGCSRVSVLIACLAAMAHTAIAANPATVLELPSIEVVSTTPIPGLGTPLQQIPGNVQTISAKKIDEQHASDFSEMLNQNMGSVSISDTQSSPVQMDVNFRGFTASPVLGTPQGLSVFVDGVRVNEAFGDVVNWDLLPKNAISTISIMPGSNPVFGLNTLGGAISVNTKSGFDFPGTALTVSDGTWNRRTVNAETGGHGETVDYFIATSFMDDNGWAQHNPTLVKQLFGKTGYQNDKTDVDLSYTYANNLFRGNQAIPLSFMNNLAQSYTWPDIEHNSLSALNLKGSQFLNDQLLLAGNVYSRRVNTTVYNSNGGSCAVYNPVDTVNPGTLFNSGTQTACNIQSNVEQLRTGGATQLTATHPWWTHNNTITSGVSFDHGDSHFTESLQPLTVAMPANRYTANNNPSTGYVDIKGYTNNIGLYLTDTFAINPKTFLTVSSRYDHAIVKLEDQNGSDLNGEHSYNRVNPSAGLTFNPNPELTTFINYNQGMRVPTPVELGCADPTSPCALPSAFASDPNLKAVTSSTWELGARGKWNQSTRWNFALFDSLLNNDIQYLPAPNNLTSGYFANVGQTQRRGFETGVESNQGQWHWFVNYTFLDATFLTPMLESNTANSTCTGSTTITCSPVRSGDRMPGIPRHLLKLRLDYTPVESITMGFTMMAQSNQFARGNENNQDVNGPLPGFAVFNLDGRYLFNDHWELFAKVDNVFNRRYSSFAQLGSDAFTGPNQSYNPGGAVNTQFRAIAPPIGAWIGVTWRFGGGPNIN